MAFAGNKKGYGQWIKNSFDWSSLRSELNHTVDPFGGSIALTNTFRKAFDVPGNTIVAESFEPLRRLYKVPFRSEMLEIWAKETINLLSLNKWLDNDLEAEFAVRGRVARAVSLIDRENTLMANLGNVWRGHRVLLSQGEERSFVVLQALSVNHSMRHGPNVHNVLPQASKLLALKKRRNFIDPLHGSLPKGTKVFDCWEEAVNPIGNFDSSSAALLLDPPYIGGEKIYPKEDPIACAAPPIESGMRRGYAAIVAFNYYSADLNSQYISLAERYGYSVEPRSTNFRSRFNNTKTRKGGKQEFCWLFLPKSN